MIVNFQINNVTIQANGDDMLMIRSGILSHLIEIEKILQQQVINSSPVRVLPKDPKKDIQDLDYNGENPEDEEKKGFDPDYDSLG
jgi:hypothetical protein